MPNMKLRFGRQVAADVIVLNRGRGWHTRRLINGTTSFREVINHFIPLGGLNHAQFPEAQIIATISDIVGARNGVATFRVYPNPYTTRYEQVAQSWASHAAPNTNPQLAYVEGVLFASFLKGAGIIDCEGDYFAALPEFVNEFVPNVQQILGFIALDSTIEQMRRLFEDAVRDLKSVRDNSSNMHMTSVAYYMTRFWDDVVDCYDQEVATLNRYTPHLLSVVWHGLYDQGDYVPRTIDPASVIQMTRLSNIVVEAIYNGVGSALADAEENWALHLFNKIYTAASREDSYIRIADTLATFKDGINIFDFKGDKGGEDLLRIIRPSKITSYDFAVGRVRNAHAQQGGYYFIPNSDATGKVSQFLNDMLGLMDVTKVWTERMLHHYGTAIQYVSTLNNADQSMSVLRQAAALVLAQEVELNAGSAPIFSVVSNPETYKRIYGIDLVRGKAQKVLGVDRVIATTLNEIKPDRDWVKHQIPLFDVKPDEIVTQNPLVTPAILPHFDVDILDYEGVTHRKRLSVQRALGMIAATDLHLVGNTYYNDEVNYIAPHWQLLLNQAQDYGPFFGEWLREALRIAQQWFDNISPTLIQQTNSFIPREDVETRETRLVKAANALEICSSLLTTLNPQLGQLYEGTLLQALNQHHLYTMVN